MMDGLYSVSLLAALISATLGGLSGVAALRWPKSWLRQSGLGWALLGLILGTVSFALHLRFGHGLDAPEPMGLGRFIEIHPAYGVVLLLSVTALGAWFRSRRQVRDGTHSRRDGLNS